LTIIAELIKSPANEKSKASPRVVSYVFTETDPLKPLNSNGYVPDATGSSLNSSRKLPSGRRDAHEGLPGTPIGCTIKVVVGGPGIISCARAGVWTAERTSPTIKLIDPIEKLNLDIALDILIIFILIVKFLQSQSKKIIPIR
jgi:hypothetical protein